MSQLSVCIQVGDILMPELREEVVYVQETKINTVLNYGMRCVHYR